MQLMSLQVQGFLIPFRRGIRTSKGECNRKEKLDQEEIQTLPKSIGASLLTSVSFWCGREKSNRLNGKQIDLLDAQIPWWMMPWAETRDYWSPLIMAFIYYTSDIHMQISQIVLKRENTRIKAFCITSLNMSKNTQEKNITLHLHFCLQY